MKLFIVSNTNIYLYILYITLHLIYIALFSSLYKQTKPCVFVLAKLARYFQKKSPQNSANYMDNLHLACKIYCIMH